MSDLISNLSAWRGMRAVATLAAVLTAMALSVIESRAQSYDNNNTYDDGSYPSDSGGGYTDSDDEDGYEDGQDAPDVGYFHDELEDQGEWISHGSYGQVWRPRDVDSDWRPYTRGTWANTEEHGWYWVSDEKFGWATYHYGRWHLDDRYGWVWVPGTRWGPAWVTWRSNDDQVGWAPLPPEAYWEHGSGLRFETRVYEEERYRPYWSFVSYRHISSPRVYQHCAPRANVWNIVIGSRPADSHVYVNRRIVNRGISVSRVESVTRTRLTTVRVNATDNRSYRSVRRDRNVLNVYRPRLTRAAVGSRPRPANRPAVDRAAFRDVDKRPVRGAVRPRRDQPAATRDRPVQAPRSTGIPTNIPGGGIAPRVNGRPEQPDRAVRLPGNVPPVDRSVRVPAPRLPGNASGIEPRSGRDAPRRAYDRRDDRRGQEPAIRANRNRDIDRAAPRNRDRGPARQAVQRGNPVSNGILPNPQKRAAPQRNRGDEKRRRRPGEQE
jgi:hypothetical protein